jgi:hypothetical protein
MILRKTKLYLALFIKSKKQKKIARIYNGVYCLNPLDPYVSGIEKRALYSHMIVGIDS